MSSTITVQIEPSAAFLAAVERMENASNKMADAAAIFAGTQSKASPDRPPAALTGVETKPAAVAEIARPQAPAAGDKSGPVMSPERAQLLRREWAAGVDIQAILRRLNELPGKRIDAGSLGIRANSLGLKRPKGFDFRKAPQTYDEAMAKLAPVPSLPPIGERVPLSCVGQPIEADLEQVREWAAARGITVRDWDDLPRVNRKCEELGVATFKRRLPGRSVHRTSA